ncbi:MAG: 16S rRNA (adenine(1518)-N(6)/adenine(1519)-N(6))-dimethyltransferase RsmA [Candidatus Moraniibacteriota bacterium]|jgi:16S rRNA (adenine1518-N6/adenine1519-N6)-dimethyltransferase
MTTTKPKKSLGQNFLRDNAVLDRIIQAANLSADDFVIEVGPGEGVLTERLMKCAKKVVAIEIDKDLALRLDSRLRGNDKVETINADILEINLPELIEKNTKMHHTPNPSPYQEEGRNTSHYKVIANIPYYITSPIIRLFLETNYPPTEMILMVQKEVAERICAKAGKLSILALSVQYYATPELLFTVPKTAFFPVPEVDSAVIRITRNERPAYAKASTDETKKFFKIVKAGFSAKRKTLVNNLSSSLKLEKAFVEEKLKQIGISQNQRAQELRMEDWKNLANSL